MKKVISIKVRKTEKVSSFNFPKEIEICNTRTTVYVRLRENETDAYIDTNKIVETVKTILVNIKKDYPLYTKIFIKETSPNIWTFYVEYEEETLIESFEEGVSILSDEFNG